MSLVRHHEMMKRLTPSIPSGATNSFNSGTVTLTPARTPESGNLLFAAFGGVTARTVSAAPSGWVQVGTTPTGSGCLFHYYKIAGGSEPANYAFTLSGTTNGQWVFYELKNTYEIAYFTESVNSAAGTVFTHSSININKPSIALASIQIQASTTITPPANYIITTTNFRHELGVRLFPITRPVSTPSWTLSTSQTAMIKISVFSTTRFHG